MVWYDRIDIVYRMNSNFFQRNYSITWFCILMELLELYPSAHVHHGQKHTDLLNKYNFSIQAESMVSPSLTDLNIRWITSILNFFL